MNGEQDGREDIRTGIFDCGSRFSLLSFSSGGRLAGLLDASRGRSSGFLARNFDGSGDGGRVARSGGIGFGLSDLAELLQVLLDGARSASDGVGSELERCYA